MLVQLLVVRRCTREIMPKKNTPNSPKLASSKPLSCNSRGTVPHTRARQIFCTVDLLTPDCFGPSVQVLPPQCVSRLGLECKGRLEQDRLQTRRDRCWPHRSAAISARARWHLVDAEP